MMEARHKKERIRFTPRFPLGRVVMTHGVGELVENRKLNPLPFLVSHAHGQWGDLCAEDKRVNELSIQGGRLMSAYKLDKDVTLWIITESDRSVTTLLLPSEY